MKEEPQKNDSDDQENNSDVDVDTQDQKMMEEEDEDSSEGVDHKPRGQINGQNWSKDVETVLGLDK